MNVLRALPYLLLLLTVAGCQASEESTQTGTVDSPFESGLSKALDGDTKGAMKALRRAVRDGEPDEFTPRLWLAGIAGETEGLERNASYTDWQNALVGFLRGEIEADLLLVKSKEAEAEVIALRNRCQARLYLGLVAERLGDIEGAKAEYQACVASDVSLAREQAWANKRLARLLSLDSSHEQPGEKTLETWVQELESAKGHEGVDAVIEIAKFGPRGATAVPVLVSKLGGDGYRLVELVMDALEEIGTVAVPALTLALSNKEDAVRMNAARVLGRLGPGARSASAGLARSMMKDNNVEAARALFAVALPEVSASALTKALHSPNGRIRADAADLLGKLGPFASQAASALTDRAKVESMGIRLLEDTGKGRAFVLADFEALNGLLDALKAVDPERYVTASIELSALPGNLASWHLVRRALEADPSDLQRAQLEALLDDLLAHEYSTVRMHCLETVGRQGLKGKRFMAQLLETAVDPKRGPLEQASALLALRKIGSDAETVMPVIVKALGSSNVTLRGIAVRSLNLHGKDAALAIPQLERALKDKDPGMRKDAQDALESIRKGGGR